MLKAIEAYLALRRATGFAMLNAEYLLKSFAAFATERGQTHVHTQTAIDWAARGPSVAQRDARLKAVCRFVRHVRVEDARHELPPAQSLRRPQDAALAAYLLRSGDRSPDRGRPSTSTQRRLALTDLRDIDRTALSHRVEDLRSAEVDGRRRDARRPADPRDQVPENPPGAAARHGGSGLEALSGASRPQFRD